MLKKLFFVIATITTTSFTMLPPYLSNNSAWAEKTLQSLTLRQKIGQLFIVAAASNFNQPNESLASSLATSPYTMDANHIEMLIKDYYVGGIIFLYKSDPATQMALMKKFKSLSVVPLFIAQDCEWGLSMRLDIDPTKVVRYPRNMTLGAITNDQLIYDLGHEIGKQCAAIGIHMNFAPVVDINNNPENPVIHDRSFGDNPQRIAHLGALFARGLQNAGVIACAKHFPGHGDTTIDSHFELPVIEHDKKKLNEVELVPFKALIDEGVGAVMNAHLAVPELDSAPNKPSSLSYPVVTQELKNNLGFKGLVITDGLGMQAITKQYSPGELELNAVLAGNDILLCPVDVPRATELIEEAIHNGRISETDLNQRVLKVLKAKEWAYEQQKQYQALDLDTFLIRPDAYALQTKAYQAAITLVKNSPMIPLEAATLKNSCIIQTGEMPENSFAINCKRTSNNVINCTSTMSNEKLEKCLQAAQMSDNVVVALGQMNKFAHKKFGIADNTFILIERIKEMQKKLTVVVFGTPYSLQLFNDADTIIVAYEDAPAAQEAAVDLLLGRLQAQGKLPITFLET
jgi:beta-N-acetylhexosaminidase